MERGPRAWCQKWIYPSPQLEFAIRRDSAVHPISRNPENFSLLKKSRNNRVKLNGVCIVGFCTGIIEFQALRTDWFEP